MDHSQELGGNPQHTLTNIAIAAPIQPSASVMGADLLNVTSAPKISVRLTPDISTIGQHVPQAVNRWPVQQLTKYLNDAYFFNPYRHSRDEDDASEVGELDQDGSNLARRLHTIQSGDERLFNRIRQFITDSLPDVGTLLCPLTGGNTYAAFRPQHADIPIRLRDMGGGIEQLLMVATVLLSTSDRRALFIEEPESHLHPGAQQFLIERLYSGDRQIFVNTHSPTFVNVPRDRTIHRIEMLEGWTTAQPVENPEALSASLEDVGVRNSDVLLSDAVLFVEGPGDRRALSAWAATLGLNLAAHRVDVLPMGGGENAPRGLPIRSEVLSGISKKAPVPHMFVLDRDERSKAEVAQLEDALGGRLHFWVARELENYMLVPRALLAALRRKYKGNQPVLDRLPVDEREVAQLITSAANGLYGLVLLKRIRKELGGLAEGLLTREVAATLVSEARNNRLAKLIVDQVEASLAEKLRHTDIDAIVQTERVQLDAAWTEDAGRLSMAPGDEIICAVFEKFGGEYKKPVDTGVVAAEMTKEEIAPEITGVLRAAIDLPLSNTSVTPD
jgi:hypothetical protein